MSKRILNNRYALEAKVGEGGMAVTYRARDLLLNRPVAVKLMREQFTADPQFIERFRREAQAAARLAHENIAGVYDTGYAEGTYYIVMEFVEGTDLKQRVRRDGPLPVVTALEIAHQIAGALDAAHRCGLVHRDIKPHNILLTPEGKVKVTDFGIAKLAADGEDTGVIMGSVHYLSPEQARGEATTPSSDLYALGAVLFEMVTGRTVFEGENAMAVAHRQIYDLPPHPAALRADLPPAVEAVILRCLEKEPQARYQSAGELQAVLARLLNQLGQEATVVTPGRATSDATMVYRGPGTAAPPVRRREPAPPPEEPAARGGAGGWLFALLFLLLAAAVTYGVFQLIGGVPPGPPRPNGEIVPDLVGQGLTEEQALGLLNARGLTGTPQHDRTNDAEKGRVYRQDPAPRSRIDPKRPVVFWVSDGRVSFLMPDVVNMSLQDAKTAIRKLGYEANFIVTREPSDQAKGTVIRHEPAVGAEVAWDGKVTLTLSTGEIQQEVITYDPGSAVKLQDSETTFVRVEFERPKGSDPQTLVQGTFTPGERIPTQHIQRNANEPVLVRVLAGKDEMSLETISEETFPATR